MRTLIILSAGLMLALLAIPAWAQEDDKPVFSGTWQFDPAKSDMKLTKISSATWVIQEADNTIHITESENGKGKKVEVQCTTDGKECKFPGDRRASFWYNGTILVEMETKNDHVIRYQLKLSEGGKTMTVETTPIVPQSDKSDTMVFQKQI